MSEQMSVREARYKALGASLREAESHKRAANAAAVSFFFFIAGVLALVEKLTVGWAVLLAFSCFVLRYTLLQRWMNKWSDKRLAEINAKYPRPEDAGSGATLR